MFPWELSQASSGLGLNLCKSGCYRNSSREEGSPLVGVGGVVHQGPTAILGRSVASHISIVEAERDQIFPKKSSWEEFSLKTTVSKVVRFLFLRPWPQKTTVDK